MSRSTKIVLSVVGLLVLLALVAIGGGVWWFKSNLPELKRVGRDMETTGQEFGAHCTAPECVDSAVAQMKDCSGFSCDLGSTIFLSACLDASTVPAGFCDGVPSDKDVTATLRYRITRCVKLWPSDLQRCSRLLLPIQKFCHPKIQQRP